MSSPAASLIQLRPKGKSPRHEQLARSSLFVGLTPEELDVLQLIINWGTMQGALDHSPIDDLAVSTAVVSLMQRDYVRLV